jgi:hypothetical protein
MKSSIYVIANTVCIFMIAAGWAASPTDNADQHHLLTDATFVIFSGDVIVNYSLPEADNTFIVRLVSVDSAQLNVVAVARLSVTAPSTSGRVTFGCDVIVSAGRYAARLFETLDDSSGEILRAEAVFVAVWPNVVLKLAKSSYVALTDDIVVEVSVHETHFCTSVATFLVELYPTVVMATPPQSDRFDDRRRTAALHGVVRDVIMTSRSVSVTFPCHVVDRLGQYHVLLRSRRRLQLVAASDVIDVVRSDQYDVLPVDRGAIYPSCDRSVSVRFRRPPCASRMHDKIRVYRRLVSDMTTKFQSKLEYIGEQRVGSTSQSHVEFDCELFDPSDPGYCFKYISLASNGAVREEASTCVTAWLTTGGEPVDGGWSSWTEWTDCSVTCGNGGVQTRYRTCDSPRPANGGTFCAGGTTQSRICQTLCTQDRTTTSSSIPLHHFNETLSDMDCDCGCAITVSQSITLVAAGIHNCPTDAVRQWSVHANNTLTVAAVIRMSFLAYTFTADDLSCMLLVRDGESVLANVLWSSNSGRETVVSDGDVTGQSVPHDVVTSGPHLTVLFMAPVNHSCGFVAMFTAEYFADENSVPSAASNSSISSLMASSFSFNQLISIGTVVLCMVFIVAALILVCYDRCCVRRAHRTRPTAAATTSSSMTAAGRRRHKGQLPNPMAFDSDYHCKTNPPCVSPKQLGRNPTANDCFVTPSYEQNLQAWNEYNARYRSFYHGRSGGHGDIYQTNMVMAHPYYSDSSSSSTSGSDDELFYRHEHHQHLRGRYVKGRGPTARDGDGIYLTPAVLRVFDSQTPRTCAPHYERFLFGGGPVDQPTLPHHMQRRAEQYGGRTHACRQLVLGPESLYDEDRGGAVVRGHGTSLSPQQQSRLTHRVMKRSATHDIVNGDQPTGTAVESYCVQEPATDVINQTVTTVNQTTDSHPVVVVHVDLHKTIEAVVPSSEAIPENDDNQIPGAVS